MSHLCKRSNKQATVNWQFATEDARIKPLDELLEKDDVHKIFSVVVNGVVTGYGNDQIVSDILEEAGQTRM